MDIRSVLSKSWIYSFFVWLTTNPSYWKIFVSSYIRPKRGDSILDMGCGTAEILDHLSNIYYLGFDMSSTYIQSAQKKYGHKAKFQCDRVNQMTLDKPASFDIVLAIGLLHHLNDQEAIELFELAKFALKPNGKLITLDGVFVSDQSWIARWLLSIDRGQYVRKQDHYVKLATQVFPNVKVNIRSDLLRIPYTHILLDCSQ